MSKNTEDSLIREKTGNLSPLGAGIVFGKEEAWDKLQARMDKPAAKVIPLRYWMSAAAVLLLFVTVMMFYYRPGRELVKQIDKGQEVAPLSATPEVLNPQPQPQVTAIAKENATANEGIDHKKKVNTIKKQQSVLQPEIAKVQIAEVSVPEMPLNEVAVAVVSIAPAVPVKAHMKVVHVNDVDMEAVKQGQAVAAVLVPEPVLRNNQVVHLNDVTAQQQAMNEYLNHRKDNFAVTIPFLKSSTSQTWPAGNTENATTHNYLTFRIN